nr:hypothetical protein [Tanacetum cinerariifolium]
MNEFCTKKVIRREFSNARTPQQNRVAKRRNITLIEATRTMLADAKLLVTFWAEVVNTACYFQNKVLVNKSQNKTPYELFNSRIPAMGFLKPFRCHVMILNTLDHLGKFDAKGDEENKLIKKGAGPNWLFDIDTLTNLINYVPVVVAGTSSTNISGTKDVASQAVKKDVSSLRYIALPNWFHEAHIETSNDTIRNSDAHDDSQKEQDCNADVPESSGISNPTATSKDIYAAGSESRPPMLNKENYVPWSSRLLRYAKSRPNGQLIHNSILNGPYVRRMIPESVDVNHDVNQIMKGSDIGIQEKKAKLFNEWERQMKMVGGNGGNQFRQYAGQNAGNLNRYNAVQNVRNQVAQNLRVQNDGNQNQIGN